MSDSPFDMPPIGEGFPARGRWVIDHLSADLNITETRSAGIVGNIGYESAGLATLQEIKPLVEGSRGGYGWPQWTADRRRDFERWCVDNRLAPASNEANYRYLVYELQFTPVGLHTMEALRRTTTLEEAVFAVGRIYETPAGTTKTHLPGFAGRLRYAEQALSGPRRSAMETSNESEPGSATADVAIASMDTIAAAIEVFVEAASNAQVALQTLGLYQGRIDGDWGPQSRAALTAYRVARRYVPEMS